MESQVENKKVLKAGTLTLEHLTGISKKSGQPYDIIVGTLDVEVAGTTQLVKVSLDQNVASFLFNI